VSELKDKRVGEFNSLLDVFVENIRTWIVDYVNLNNNISNIVIEA
jgi:hypothetical protein